MMSAARMPEWGRLSTCAPVVNRNCWVCFARVQRRVINPPQVGNLPHMQATSRSKLKTQAEL